MRDPEPEPSSKTKDSQLPEILTKKNYCVTLLGFEVISYVAIDN